MAFAIVIPAFNESRTIRSVAERALRQCATVIVVDDGSTDGTRDALAGLAVHVVRHPTNRGKAASLWDGFQYALEQNVDAVITLDGDGQHRPEDVPRLVNAARENPHRVLIGARLLGRDAYPWSRRKANHVADFWISWAAGHCIADSQSGQRLYPVELLRQLRVRHDAGAAFTFESEALIRAARLGFTTVAVPIQAIFNAGGRPSHFRPVRDIARIAWMVARQLLATGLYPLGLWRSLRFPANVAESIAGTGINAADGVDEFREAS
ncbi:MAG: glycosyltransferase family 2 protein [Betaproteobacteria bacterium]